MPERGQQERHRQSGGVDGQKKDAFPDSVLSGGESEHDRQDRTYTWRPAEGESKTNHKRAPGGGTAFEAVQSRVGQQSLDLQDAGQVKAEENDDHSGDAGEQRFVLAREPGRLRSRSRRA